MTLLIVSFILACVLSAGSAMAQTSTPSFATVHEATLVGDEIEWRTRTVACGRDAPPLSSAMVVAPLDRRKEVVRLSPPLVRREVVQAVSFRDRDLVFVPNDDLAPHRTRHGFEVLRPDPAAAREAVRCLRDHGIVLAPSALLVSWPAGRPDPPVLEGTLVRRHDGTRALFAGTAALFVGGVFGALLAWRRLERRVRFEAAEAVLRADMPDL
jgi:hypothetical protein